MGLALVLWLVPGPVHAEPARVPDPDRRAVAEHDVDFDGDGHADMAVGDIFATVDGQFGGAIHVLYGTAAGLTRSRAQFWTENDFGGQSHRWDIFGGSLASGDFDGDGYSDLAIGIESGELVPPFGDEGPDHGLVRIVYGSPTGLTTSRTQLWSLGRLAGGAERGHSFGQTLTAANFGRSRQDDLAVGTSTGVIAIIYGSDQGLSRLEHQLISQNTPGIRGSTQASDGFGSTLAAGRFRSGAYADLAVSIPGERVGRTTAAGAVAVIYGSADGLTARGNQLWSQASKEIGGKAEIDDEFGTSLATGDLNGDGAEDLAIGTPQEDIGRRENAGTATVIYGSRSGLRAKGSQVWSQASRGVPGRVEFGDGFGSSLAIGNLGHDLGGRAFGDLAIGAHRESVGRVKDAGSVTLLYGRASGLRSKYSRALTQRSRGIPGKPRYQALFGSGLEAGDFDRRTSGTTFDDLVIGGSEPVDRYSSGDTVTVAFGAARGLDTNPCQLWHPGKLGHPFDEDTSFGYAVAA